MTMLQHFEGCHLPLFIETGTAEGNSLAFASLHFTNCVSIEQNEQLYLAACERFKSKTNVKLYRGHSPHVLRVILNPKIPTTFWLDAHYSAQGNTLMPGRSECPLMEELDEIMKVEWEIPPIIMIDDAFMYDDSVPHPGSTNPFWFSNESDHIVYHRSQWPRVEEIDAALPGFTRSLLDGENALRYAKV